MNCAIGIYSGDIKDFFEMTAKAYEDFDGIVMTEEMYDALCENANSVHLSKKLFKLLSINTIISDMFMYQFNGANFAFVDTELLMRIVNGIAIPIVGGTVVDYMEEDEKVDIEDCEV